MVQVELGEGDDSLHDQRHTGTGFADLGSGNDSTLYPFLDGHARDHRRRRQRRHPRWRRP